MSALQRRAIQLGVLVVVGLVWLAELTSPRLADLPTPAWFQALTALVPGSAFAVSGLVAWSLRPTSRVGLLMMGVGVGLLIGVHGSPIPVTLVASSIGDLLLGLLGRAPADLYRILGPLWEVVLLQLLLASPSGRLGSWTSRGLVGALYVLLPLADWIGLYQSPLAIRIGSPGVVIEYRTLVSILYQASFAVCFVLIMKRWIQGGHARRRSLSPVLWSVAPLSVVFLISTLEGLLPHVVGSGYNQKAFETVYAPALESLLLIALPVAVLVGLLRSGFDMSSVASLVVKLSKGLLPDQLQPTLARVLHDPSLEVLYWVPSLEAFADFNGKPEELPAPDSERAASVLDGEASPVAALVYDASLLHEPELVETAAAAVRMALQNAGLQVQLRAQLEEVRQSRARLAEAGQQERQRVERDLHDGAQQQLVTLLLALQATKLEATQHADPETAAMLDANISSLKQALSELRELARGIHPSILTEAGLVPALRSLAERCPIPVEVSADSDRRFPAQLEATLYFVASEAITNAVKHSGAQRVRVSLRRESKTLVLIVGDDGRGGADLSGGSGLSGLSDRLAAIGGRLQIESDGQDGTIIRGEIPCA